MVFCDWLLSFGSTLHQIVFQYCVSFGDQIMLHRNHRPCFVYHSSVQGRLGCFPSLPIGNSAAMNSHVQLFVETLVFNSFGYMYS